jgi:hypothetical protein
MAEQAGHAHDVVEDQEHHQDQVGAQAISHPTRETAPSFINAWTDTRQTRTPESKAYAMLNDLEQPVSGNVIGAVDRQGTGRS